MKKEIKAVNEKLGIMRVTTTDERWYLKPAIDDEKGLPIYEQRPSVTFITAYYPKGKFFEEWLKKNGDEAELIKRLAGEKGTKVHKACEMLLRGEEVPIDAKFINPTTEQPEELSVEEYRCIMSFAAWWKTLKNVAIVGSEFLIWPTSYNFAGTVDLLLEIDNELYVIDLKTSQSLHEEHKLQISAYKHALMDMGKLGDYDLRGREIKTAILQLGYKRNGNEYKFTEVDDKFDVFEHTQGIWKNEIGEQAVLQRDYPLKLKINVPTELERELGIPMAEVAVKPKKKVAKK